MALAAYWLGDRLSPEVRNLLDENLERRTFTPFTSLITTGKPPMWWLTSQMNWNSVCLAGVTGAALASIESPKRRAFFAASAEKYIEYFLKGFTPDGYCDEGVGYWNYGFGHFAMLAETLRQATGGKVDLLAAERIRPDCSVRPADGNSARHISGIFRQSCGRETRPAIDGVFEPPAEYGLVRITRK